MDREKLPIKFFAPRKIDELRVEPGGDSTPPKWVLTGSELEKQSAKLSTEIDALKEIMLSRKNEISTLPFIFIAKMCNGATAKSRRKDISGLFQINEYNNIIGLVKKDELIIQIDSLDEMKTVSSKVKDFSRNNYAISCLASFVEFKPIFNISEVIKEYKIKLVRFKSYEQNQAIQRLFEKNLCDKKINFKKTKYTKQCVIYKLFNIQEADLDELRNDDIYEVLFSVEPMPKYIVTLDDMSDEKKIRIMYPNVSQKYVTVGILDNGIEPIPHLSPWLASERWSVYPKENINPTHGTFVAGVALYGDLCAEHQLVGHHGLKLFDATVFPDTTKAGLDEDELIENIKKAIGANYKKVKIWNLSISITRPVSDDRFSDLAMALDALQDQYNILICKSAGNSKGFLLNRPRERLHEGADSVRSLVVGSVAHAKGEYDLAEIDNPSPFSRIGPGPEYIIKPEVSHYGGNAGVDENGELVTTGITSFSKDGSLSRSVGTSYSTPRVAALAAGIYQELNEDFDPLLLKALIVHSATYSENLKIPEEERTKQLGFGVPKTVNQILYNAPNEATLILRGNLAKGEFVDIMDFPMPMSLVKNGFFTGQIIATLAYDPILDATQGIEYCQSNIDVKFGSYDKKTARDTNKRTILNPVGREGTKNLFQKSLYSKTKMKDNIDDFALRERLLIQYGDKYYPVKKYAVDLSELTESNKSNFLTPDKKWYLYIRGLFRDHIEKQALLNSTQLRQELCLVLTVRDPSGQANIYDEVTQKLDEYNFWHSNIKVSSDVNIKI